MGKTTAKTTTRAAEAREVRDSRRAYAGALVDRLADLLADDDCDDHEAEASDLADSLYVILHRERGDGCPR